MKHILVGGIFSIWFAVGAQAALTLDGSFAMNPIGRQTNSFGYTATSLALASRNFVTDTEGGFSNLISEGDYVTAYPALLSKISLSASHPTMVTISNYLVFSAPDPIFGGAGSTPTNRFSFELTSIYSNGGQSGGNYAAFFGTGILFDKAGTYAPTVAQIALSFSSTVGFSSANYGLSFDATGVAASIPSPAPAPEPGTLALLGTGLAAMMGVRRRH